MRFHTSPSEDEEEYYYALTRLGWLAQCPTCKMSLRLHRSLYDLDTNRLTVWSLCPTGHTNVQLLEK